MLTSSSTSLPFTRNPLEDSRCPLIERLPGFASPDGGVEATPVMMTAPGCAVFCGTIPGCTAIRSVKLRPFSGTALDLLRVQRLAQLRAGGLGRQSIGRHFNGLRVALNRECDIQIGRRCVGTQDDLRSIDRKAARADFKLIGPGSWQTDLKCTLIVRLGRPSEVASSLAHGYGGTRNDCAGCIVHCTGGLIRLGHAK